MKNENTAFELNQYVFIGGVFGDIQYQSVIDNSIGVIQNAADSLQKGILSGLVDNGERVRVISLPFVGSYPKRYKNVYFRAEEFTYGDVSSIKSVGFINLSVFKIISRTLALTIELIANKDKYKKSNFIVYSLHLPFILPSILFKLIYGVNLIIVIPDLPEYMSDSKNIIYRIFKGIDSTICSLAIKYFDFYVTLTKSMQKKMGLDSSRSIVIEGIVPPEVYSNKPVITESKKSFLYSGTLARRYGIRLLVDAFELIQDQDCELWICGAGDSEAYIKELAAKDSRIKFFGQVSREHALSLQSQARVLVNPRTGGDEYTKYSFPSKVMEYFSSGKPVIMFKLGGIPSEYYEYCFVPISQTKESLAECMSHVASLPFTELNRIGSDAKKFVSTNKSPKAQVLKLIDLVNRYNH